MNLKDISTVLMRNIKFILIITLIGGLAGFGYSHLNNAKVEAGSTLYIKREAEQVSSSYYNYDGFYAEQVGKDYTDTILGMLKTLDPYRDASDKLSNSITPTDLLGNTQVKKISSQVISITIGAQSEPEARSQLNALVSSLTSKVTELNKTGDRKITVESLHEEPLVLPNKSAFIITISVGFLSGLLIALVVLTMARYLKETK